ncbi:MAG: cation-transporting P-type ATPase [Parcubacteria group bacterium]
MNFKKILRPRASTEKKKWFALSLEEVWQEIKSSPEGLSNVEAAKRLQSFGLNELPQNEGEPPWKLFVNQFRSPLMYLMILATFISYFIGNVSNTIFIIIVTLSNASVGFYQEYKANKSLNALKGLIKQETRVLRGGREQEVLASELVPGDVVILRVGDKVPADGRIFELNGLRIDESNLTGEAKSVEKQLNQSLEVTEIGERTSMVFMGTLVEEGSAKIVVVETGLRTEYGDIVSLLRETPEEPTPLQKTVGGLLKIVGLFISLVILLIVIEGYIAGRSFAEIFAIALALFVSSIPEGLLPAITIVLTFGMRRIIKQKALVRRLAAMETLGGVTVICTDKTGTLTLGTTAVSSIITAEGITETNGNNSQLPVLARQTLEASLLSSDAFIENPDDPYEKLVIRGRSIEQAFLRAGFKYGLKKDILDQERVVLDTLFFSSERKYSASVRQDQSGHVFLYAVGAPEQMLEHISFIKTSEGYEKKRSKAYKEVIEQIETYAKQGFRLVACVEKEISSWKKNDNVSSEIKGLSLIGLIALNDPVRKEVPRAFEKTRDAGIRTVIVTGDHYMTALAVVEKIGLPITKDQVLLGHQIEEMSDADLKAATKNTLLYARVSPRHKLRIVQAFQELGETVAMFGDGVNDAPALKAANIGVAVNPEIDAAREVADIVLMDSGFNTIVKAIEEGRIIFNNIRRVFLYLITQDFSQFFIFLFSIAFGLPLPLIAAQLLFVNLVESGLPDIALTIEEERDGIMQEPPRKPGESVVNKPILLWMITSFFLSGIVATALYLTALSITGDLEKTRTMVMVLMCLESFLLAFSLRSFNRNIWRKSLFNNRWLTGAVIISFLMVLGSIYIPVLQKLLSTVALSPKEWIIILAVNVCEIVLIDMLKMKFLSNKLLLLPKADEA